MFKILKVTNNVNEAFHYNVEKLIPNYYFWNKWELQYKSADYYHGSSKFNNILDCLYYIKAEMNIARYESTRTQEYVFSNLTEVLFAISNFEEIEEGRIKEALELKTQQDESANRETKA